MIWVLFRDHSECWDAARTMNVPEAYEKTVHCYRLSMRMLKIATYVVLNIGVLLTALVSKGALLLMTNSVAKVQEVRIKTDMSVQMFIVCFRHLIENVGYGCY